MDLVGFRNGFELIWLFGLKLMSSSIFFRVDGSLVYPMEALSILGSVVYGSSGKEVHPLRKSLNQQRTTTAGIDVPYLRIGYDIFLESRR